MLASVVCPSYSDNFIQGTCRNFSMRISDLFFQFQILTKQTDHPLMERKNGLPWMKVIMTKENLRLSCRIY